MSKKILVSVAALLFAVGASYADIVMISKFEPNPVGTDALQVSLELSGSAGASFDGWILSIESDIGPSSGIVDEAVQLSGTFDSNGLLTFLIDDFENPSFTLAVTDRFTGVLDTTDIDTNNDGVVDDLSTLGNIYDAIGIPDNSVDATYGTQLGGLDFAFTGDEPKLIFRAGSFGEWYAVNDDGNVPEEVFDINGNLVANSAFSADPEVSTFGALNSTAIPEPRSIAVLSLFGVAFVARRRK